MPFQLTETSAFKQFKPLADAIEARMIESVTRRYNAYIASYGGTYPSRRELTQGWRDTAQGQAFYPVQRYAVGVTDNPSRGFAGHPIALDTDKLAKDAKQLGEDSVTGFVAKLIDKLGNIELRDLDFQGGANFTIWADLNGHTVRVDQQTVYKISNQHTMFCQFPARIYVDGKFTPAAQFHDATKAVACHLCYLAADEIERLRAENGRLRGGLTLRQPPVVPRPFKPAPRA